MNGKFVSLKPSSENFSQIVDDAAEQLVPHGILLGNVGVIDGGQGSRFLVLTQKFLCDPTFLMTRIQGTGANYDSRLYAHTRDGHRSCREQSFTESIIPVEVLTASKTTQRVDGQLRYPTLSQMHTEITSNQPPVQSSDFGRWKWWRWRVRTWPSRT